MCVHRLFNICPVSAGRDGESKYKLSLSRLVPVQDNLEALGNVGWTLKKPPTSQPLNFLQLL